MSKIFSESLEKDLSNDVFQSKTSSEPKFDIFRPRTMGYNPWYRQIGKYFYLSNTKFDDTIWKVFSKLSENHKILTLDPQNSSYSSWKSPRTID